MKRLTDLPDDVLLMIAAYLKPRAPVYVLEAPYQDWPDEVTKHNGQVKVETKRIKSLAQTNRRLRSLAVALLYDSIPLSHPETLRPLLSLFQSNATISSHVRHVHVTDSPASDFHHLFWLPNIITLTITSYNEWEPLDWPTASHVGSSSVQHLRLIDCGAHQEPLTQLLSWPKDLKHLWIDINWGEWDGHYGPDQPAGREVGWSCERFTECLSPVSHGVESLVLSRRQPVHEGIGYEGVIDWSKFSKLKSLCANEAFLIGFNDGDLALGSRLPPSLEELEIAYDDAGYIDFLLEQIQPPEAVLMLLQRKDEHVPHLKRVRILCEQWQEGADTASDEQQDEHIADGEEGEGGSGQDNNPETITWMEDVELVNHPDFVRWMPPRSLIQAFKSSNVSFSVFLHAQRRFRWTAPGDQGFRVNWEDSYI